MQRVRVISGMHRDSIGIVVYSNIHAAPYRQLDAR